MISKKSILVVDDDSLVRDVIKCVLTNDYAVCEASTYSEAVRIPSQSVDLAIIDYLLPDRDGLEVLNSIRKSNPALPAIIMTGYGNEDIVIQALRENVTDYMKKPLNLMYLRRRVSDVLKGEQENKCIVLSPDKGSQLDSIAEHIRQNYMHELNLDNLARLACMSRYNFCRAFKKRFGKCCIAYVNNIRIKIAAELLQNSHACITEIAFSVGYRNSGHFNRVFKKNYQQSPREYRRKMMQNTRNGLEKPLTRHR